MSRPTRLTNNASVGVALVHDDSKDARTALHRLISKHSTCFKTKTETRSGVQTLVALFSDRSMKKRKRSEPEVYLQCVLEKVRSRSSVTHCLVVESDSHCMR